MSLFQFHQFPLQSWPIYNNTTSFQNTFGQKMSQQYFYLLAVLLLLQGEVGGSGSELSDHLLPGPSDLPDPFLPGPFDVDHHHIARLSPIHP